MKVEVLVAAMHQNDHSLLDKMNINTNVIVGNQCNSNSIEEFDYKGNRAIYLNFNERGVGLNRNNALMRATGDICLFADDDMIYLDGYESMVLDAFNKFPNADIIIFNLKEDIPTRYIIKYPIKIGYHNYLRYGTARIAVRTNKIKSKGIYFNLCFGGGTEHCHGEDNIFLTDCLKKGLKIYGVPEYIARLTEERQSTWDNGYNDKYFRDQGYLYYAISNRFWKILCIQDAIRHSRKYNLSIIKTYKKMIDIER